MLTGRINVTVGEVIPVPNMLMYKRCYGGGWASRLSLGTVFLQLRWMATHGKHRWNIRMAPKGFGFPFGIGPGMEKHIETDAPGDQFGFDGWSDYWEEIDYS